MSTVKALAAACLLALVLAGTAFGLEPITPAARGTDNSSGRVKDEITMTGTVVHLGLEGGFWGINGDDGNHYDPVNLPGEFRKEGLRVRFVGRMQPDRMSFHMWGAIVEIVSIEKAGGSKDGDLYLKNGWNVLKGDRLVLWMNDRPGVITSTALLPPGAAPARHPFLTAQSRDAVEEGRLREILERSRSFREFFTALQKAGYSVVPCETRDR